MIRFLCYYCEAVLKTKEEKVGRTINCPRCRRQLRVPAAADQADAQPRMPKPALAVGGSVMAKRSRNFFKFVMKASAVVVLLGAGGAIAWHYLETQPTDDDSGEVTEDTTKKKTTPAETDWVLELRNPSMDIRYTAALKLKEREDAGGIDALAGYLLILQDKSTEDRATELRDMALMAIKKLAPDLKEGDQNAVIEQLKQTASDPDSGLRLRAVETLAGVGTPAAPALIQIMRGPDKDNRLKAAEAMAEMRDLDGYVQEMVKSMVLCDRHAKILVASVVVKIKPASPEVLPALLDGLRTSDEIFKLKAILAMGDMGVNAKEAANALYDVAKNDSNQNIKNAAIRTLERIGPAGKGKDKEKQ